MGKIYNNLVRINLLTAYMIVNAILPYQYTFNMMLAINDFSETTNMENCKCVFPFSMHLLVNRDARIRSIRQYTVSLRKLHAYPFSNIRIVSWKFSQIGNFSSGIIAHPFYCPS